MRHSSLVGTAGGTDDAAMADVERHLARWRAGGVIDTDTAERILAFEESAGAGAPERAGGFARPTATEAFLYLGLIVLVIGTFALVATNWSDMESWARVASVGVPAGVALVAGLAMRLSDDAAVHRGGQLAWLAAVVLVTGSALIIGEEFGPGIDERGPRLIAGIIAFACGIALWAAWPAHVQALTASGAIFFFAQMLGTWPDPFDQQAAGVTSAVFGLVLLVLAETGIFLPLVSARIGSAVLVAAGAFELQPDSAWYWEPWGIVAGTGLVVLSLRRETFTYIGVGMLGIFAGLMTLVGEHLADQIGGPMALILSGALIVAGVLILVQVRRSVRWGRA